MKKAFDVILKLVLSLILFMPILGVAGVFPPPTPEMYQTPEAYEFIAMLMAGKYIMFIEAIVFALAIVCLWSKRVALAALLIFPITVNIVGFHLFLDGGLFTASSIMANVLLILNLILLWQERKEYSGLLKANKH